MPRDIEAVISEYIKQRVLSYKCQHIYNTSMKSYPSSI